MLAYKSYLLFIEEEYLKDVSNVIIGYDIDVVGKNNWVQAN